MNDKFSNTNTKRNRSEVMERKGDGQKKAESLISRFGNTFM
jgi:hypothetical protein